MTAVHSTQSESYIPIVDLHPLQLSTLTSDIIKTWSADDPVVKGLSEEVMKAFSNVGFLYLINHGIDQHLIDKAHEVTNAFFELPIDVKSKYKREWPGNSNGWIGLQKERFHSDKPADYKEAYNLLSLSVNVWPDAEVPGFRAAVQDIEKGFIKLTHVVFMLIGIGLGLEEPDFFIKRHNTVTKPSFTTLRSLFYPALPKGTELAPGTLRCGEHSDFGSITLLFQDDAGGLEVKNRDGQFVPATPIEGTVLVNIGDAIQQWTTDRLISTRHRVLVPDGEAKVRRSLAYFVHADDDVIIQCLDNSDKYPAVSAFDYTTMKLDTIDKVK